MAASENPIRQRSGPSEEPCKGLVAGGGRNEDESQSAILIRPRLQPPLFGNMESKLMNK